LLFLCTINKYVGKFSSSVQNLSLDTTSQHTVKYHNVLLDKMNRSFGIRGQALELFRSYLCNGKQYTKILNYKSQLAEISHGVPQGSSLGHYFFALYQ